jgi:quercetin dioxygenase-like cupin family protein
MQKSLTSFPLSVAAFGLATGIVLAAGLAIHVANLPANLAPAPAAIMQAGASRPTAHTISSDALPHVAGKNITTMVVEFPPGGFSPPHHHGGSVTVYVLEGAIRSQLAGGPPLVYKEGQTFFEPPGVTHLVAENMSATESARILAVFVADEGATLTTYHE